MRNFALVCCTKSGRQILEYIFNNNDIKKFFKGIINLNYDTGIHKSNYDSFIDYKKKFEILYVNSINNKKCINWLDKNNVVIIFQIGWSEKFNDNILKRYCIGMHPSPLPKGRGAAVLNWAIIKNIEKWGVTFFLMNKKFDDGPMLAQKKLLIKNYDNIQDVLKKVDLITFNIFKNHINDWLSLKFKKVYQKNHLATYFKKRKPEDGLINLYKLNSDEIHNHIRALTHPFPGAYLIYRNKKLYLWKSINNNAIEDNTDRIFIKINNQLYLKSFKNNKFIEILTLQYEGFPEVSSEDFKL